MYVWQILKQHAQYKAWEYKIDNAQKQQQQHTHKYHLKAPSICTYTQVSATLFLAR